MTTKRSLKRARQLAVISTAGLALLAALAGSGGTAAADTTPATHHASTPGWQAALSGDSAAVSLMSVASVDAGHAWAAGRGSDGNGVLMGWDGQTWSAITDPALPQVQEWSAVSATSAADVWAYGTVTTADGGTQYLVHYDGQQWTAVDAAGALDRSFPEVPVKAVPGRLFKGGDALYTYSESDGTWQTFTLPALVDIQGIDALSADDAYAVGMQFPVDGGYPVAYHWDGATWTPMPQPPAPAGVTMSEVAAQGPDDVYVAGWGQPSAQPVVPDVEHWDGSAWQDVTGNLTDFVVESIKPDGNGGLWAAGEDDSTQGAAPAFWHYDGTSWTKQPGATAPDADATAPAYWVHDLAPVDGPGGSRFLAVGQYTAPATDPAQPSTGHALVERTQDSLDLTTADLAVSSTATHTVRVHAETPGRLTVGFRPADGQPAWDAATVDITVTSVSGGPQGACDHTTGPVNAVAGAVWCDLPAGDSTVSYALAAGPTVDAWQITADAGFQPTDPAAGSTPEVTAGFGVISPYPNPIGTRFFGRDGHGTLWRYDGTGNAAAPYRPRVAVSSGWQDYTAITALSRLTVHGSGDVVARDTSGVLWYYRGGGDTVPLTPQVRVGAGWNIYSIIAGTGDLTGDGRADLVARDAYGVLWLYRGTTSTTAPFAPRVKVGAGWNIYNLLAGTGDLTGDGRADLLARDASGVLWLYTGTGNAAAPYAPRVKVGTGWTIYYGALFVPGDLTGDGRADILGRDGSGVLWLYAGTGNAAAPYAPRVKVGTGWYIYNSLV